MQEKTIIRLCEILGSDRVLQNEPMRLHTTFRIGGPADVFVRIRSAGELCDALRVCREEAVPVYVIGNGSNLLVADKGISGVVLSLSAGEQESFEEAVFKDDGSVAVTVWAGEMLATFAKQATKKGFLGMEWASGIPGTVGGALRMNAGAYDGCIRDCLLAAEVLTKQGERLLKTAEDLSLSYRHSNLEEKGQTALSATFLLRRGNAEEGLARIAELTKLRCEKQPLSYPSAGSTFRRPEGYFAGKLIQDAGLRGYRVGDAQVSEKHCGFVINLGSATAVDILTLIADVKEKVQADFGVELEPEIRFLGDFSGLAERVMQACRLQGR